MVPLLPLSSVIDAIPQHVQLSFCKVDTNGNDVLVLRSAGDSIRRCREVRVEIATGGQAGPLNQHETAVEWLRAKGFDMHEQTRVLNVYRGENPEQLQYNYDGTEFEYVSGLPFIPSLGFQADINF